MALLGLVLYIISIRISVRMLSRFVGNGIIGLNDAERISILPYSIGGVLLIVPRLLERSQESQSELSPRLRQPSLWWIISAAVTAVIFVFVIGPGITLNYSSSRRGTCLTPMAEQPSGIKFIEEIRE